MHNLPTLSPAHTPSLIGSGTPLQSTSLQSTLLSLPYLCYIILTCLLPPTSEQLASGQTADSYRSQDLDRILPRLPYINHTSCVKMAPKKRPASKPSENKVTKRLCKTTDTKENDGSIAGTGVGNSTGEGPHREASGESAGEATSASIQHNTQPKVVPSPLLVWATNRQSLCDSLADFKSHQGGVYTKDKEPRGVLFGQNVEVGDVMLADKGIWNLLVIPKSILV